MQRTIWGLPDGKGIEGMSEKGEGTKKYKLIATE